MSAQVHSREARRLLRLSPCARAVLKMLERTPLSAAELTHLLRGRHSGSTIRHAIRRLADLREIQAVGRHPPLRRLGIGQGTLWRKPAGSGQQSVASGQ